MQKPFIPFLLIFIAYLLEYAFVFIPSGSFDPFLLTSKTIHYRTFTYYLSADLKMLVFMLLAGKLVTNYSKYWYVLIGCQVVNIISYLLYFKRSFIHIGGQSFSASHIIIAVSALVFIRVLSKEYWTKFVKSKNAK